MKLTETQLKEIIVNSFNEGLNYNCNFDFPAERYADYILHSLSEINH